MEKNGNKYSALHVIATVLANLTAVLSANYIVFYILDHYNSNQHYVVHSENPLTKYLYVLIPILLLLTALLYLIMLAGRGLKSVTFSKKRFLLILIVDIVAAGAFAIAVNTYVFDWLNCRSENLNTVLATMPPAEAPTDAPTPEATPDSGTDTVTAHTDPDDPDAPGTPAASPTEAPTPAPTPIPGLLGDKFKEKFSDGDPVIAEPNTTETLEDGTEKTLIYTYAGSKVAVELYHYQKGKLEYQIAELYVRDITKLSAGYIDSQGGQEMIYDFARDMNAIIAVNSDYFVTNAISEGLIIRNGVLIRNNPCKYSDLCVVYQDGTVACYDCKTDKIDYNEIFAKYPYHSFYFGPSLLDADGNPKTKFNSTLGGANPRTAFGYYEPGHYAFISVLGTRGIKDINKNPLGNGTSPGLSFVEMSQMLSAMGMKAAYNFDGGQSSGMFWNEKLFGHNTRVTGDILAIVD